MDVISNMLIAIKNAQAVHKDTVIIPHSRTKLAILEILKNSGFVKDVHVKGRRTQKVIEVRLMYTDNGIPRITEARRVSKFSRRMYASYKDLALIRGGNGIQILSTTRGMRTGTDARKEKLGGEIICEIW